jgi:hypothetical protein
MDAMDRNIEKKGIPRKTIWIGLAVLFMLAMVTKILFGDKSAKLNVDEEKFTIATVIHDKYQDYFRKRNRRTHPHHSGAVGGKGEALLIEENSEKECASNSLYNLA